MERARVGEQRESLENETRSILEEARMVLPGVQALFGFQLIAIFNSTFQELSFTRQLVHLVALISCATAMSLAMTPAAYHRIAMRGRLTHRFTELASRLIATAMAPLALSIGLDAVVASEMVVKNVLAATAIGAGLGTMFAILWFGWPAVARRRRR